MKKGRGVGVGGRPRRGQGLDEKRELMTLGRPREIKRRLAIGCSGASKKRTSQKEDRAKRVHANGPRSKLRDFYFRRSVTFSG
ncbi:hypothetical protein JTE90_010996 [Oedothorax gibbosus]|uniref:Uncharacterized protein n=1 Tax=Oedothorax gibbosus TaxID=931172 RepID=A0AAV6VCJ9_9ARAC|nr:hypothetical protein JTE90_010996 [Oedothorax gibbosus]